MKYKEFQREEMERFDEEFKNDIHREGMLLNSDIRELKSFLSSHDQRLIEWVVEKCEKMKNNKFEYHGESNATQHQDGYNQALQDLISELKK